MEPDYIDYNGRKVLTSTGLKNNGWLEENGSTFIERIIKIKDSDYKLTSENVRSIVWNLQRFTSVTYLQRFLDIITLFELEYEKFLASRTYELDDGQIVSQKEINDIIAATRNGIDAILHGDRRNGYRMIQEADHFREWFTGYALTELDYSDLGCYSRNEISGPFRYIDKACFLYSSIRDTITGTHFIPASIEDFKITTVPKTVNFNLYDKQRKYRTGNLVPFTGIWNPLTYNSGCPNYLIEGDRFPKIQIPVKCSEIPDYFSDGQYFKGHKNFEYKECSSMWQPLWEDTRYADGKIPEYEKEYLDESVAIPEGSTDTLQ